MLSIKDFTDTELHNQIVATQELLEVLDYGSLDYNAAKAELEIAIKEMQRRKI